jgi:hypothetical protein
LRLEHIAAVCLLAATAAGTISDQSPERRPLTIEGYRVLAGDFHVHTFPLSGSPLTPWDVVIEARRQDLDVIAVTAHNEVWPGHVAHWFAARFGGVLVIPGEEIHGSHFHLIAAGIQRTISWRLNADNAIAEVHRQGGVAIAAHPISKTWPAFDAAAIAQLDGVEVSQPISFAREEFRKDLEAFYQRSGAAAIGSSDYHGQGPLGFCRTYVFVREASESGVLEAIRAHRTVVLDRGRAYGDPHLIEASKEILPVGPPDPSPLARSSGVLAAAGMLLIALAELRTTRMRFK